MIVSVSLRVSVKESVEMRINGSESKNGSECGSDCESVGVCVCEIEFGCEMEGDCVGVRASVTGSVWKCVSERVQERGMHNNVCIYTI